MTAFACYLTYAAMLGALAVYAYRGGNLAMVGIWLIAAQSICATGVLLSMRDVMKRRH